MGRRQYSFEIACDLDAPFSDDSELSDIEENQGHNVPTYAEQIP